MLFYLKVKGTDTLIPLRHQTLANGWGHFIVHAQDFQPAGNTCKDPTLELVGNASSHSVFLCETAKDLHIISIP